MGEMRVSALLGARKAGVKEGGADFCVEVCRSPDLTWIGIKGLLPILQDVHTMVVLLWRRLLVQE
jgi:hypothetical protein